MNKSIKCIVSISLILYNVHVHMYMYMYMYVQLYGMLIWNNTVEPL